MDLTPLDIIVASILVGIPVLVLRLFVGLSRPQRTSKLWTFGLPVLAMLGLLVRVSITLTFGEALPSDDWVSAASWMSIPVTQAVATVYQALPEALFVKRRSRSS